MHGSWLAIDADTDLRGHTKRLNRAREGALLDGGPPAGAVRPVIARSWNRSRLAGVDPDQTALPCAITDVAAADRWARHPLQAVEPLLRDLFGEIARETRQMVMVCDRDGTLLWRLGAPSVLTAADGLRAFPGSQWSEAAAGTNAIGAALAERHPLQVFSAEHYAAPFEGWACSAAPLPDPVSGAPLGIVNLCGFAATAHPNSLALVCAAASAVRAHLAAGTGDGRRPAGPGRVAIRVLRGDHPRFVAPDGSVVPLGLRHAEILTLLATRPEGWTAEQLALEVYGERGKPVSIRAEVTRINRRLGDVVLTRPYRLAPGVACDLVEAEARLAEGRTHAALDLCDGELLTRSGIPRVDDLRRALDAAFTHAARASTDPGVLDRWLRVPRWHDDAPARRRLDQLRGA